MIFINFFKLPVLDVKKTTAFFLKFFVKLFFCELWIFLHLISFLNFEFVSFQDQECSIVDDTIVENICENMDKEDCQEVTKIVQDEECSKVIKQNCSNVQETNCSVIGILI